jgi:hypothetical protein
MAKLYIVQTQTAVYKPGTILRKYDDGYCRQQLKEYCPGKFTYEDVGFRIPHEELDKHVIPLGRGKIKWDNTSDGVFARSDSPGVLTDNGKIIGSK